MLTLNLIPQLEQIDHYENDRFMPEPLRGLDLDGYLSEDGLTILNQGTFDSPQKVAREKFVLFLENRFDQLNINTETPRPTITLQQLLSSEGLKLFKEAIKEETRSQAFREAVFLQSMNQVEGPLWDKKLVLWVGGPSASGKTYGAEKALSAMVEYVPKQEDGYGLNEYITIDGANVREISQMRKLVLQIALAYQYKGISDLNDNCSFKVGGKRVKEIVQQAALKHDTLSLVIPETFTESVFRFSNRYMTDDMASFHQDPNIFQAFSQVTCSEGQESRFQDVVKYMGSTRAWLDESLEFHAGEIDLNNQDIPCESKAYGASGFTWGRDASEEAKNRFAKLDTTGLYVKITNDLILVKQLDNGTWVECTTSQKPDFKISVRDFERWKQGVESPETTDLIAWWKEARQLGELAPANIEVLTNDIAYVPIGDNYRTEKLTHLIVTQRDYNRYHEELGDSNCSKMQHVRAWLAHEFEQGTLTTPTPLVERFLVLTQPSLSQVVVPPSNLNQFVPQEGYDEPEETPVIENVTNSPPITHHRNSKGKDEMDESTFRANIEQVEQSRVNKENNDEPKKRSSKKYRS